MSESTKISVQNLCKKFQNFSAINNISFNVNKGEVMGFLGPNGAGKSTTMKIITGFMTADSGKVLVNNLDVKKHPMAIKKLIGYLPEGAPAYGDMTTAGFLNFIADIRGYKKQEKNNRVNNAIDKANLGSVYHKTIDTLSKGFKRRVGLAQAILHDPLILIMDEPTDGLDPNQKHEVRKLITEMAEDKAILISTHILEEVDAICDRLAIMSQGELVFNGRPDALQALSTSYNSVQLTFTGETPTSALTLLKKINDVSSVIYKEKPERFVITPHNGVAIISQISQLAHTQNWHIEEAFVMPGQLDEVFRNITTSPLEPLANMTSR